MTATERIDAVDDGAGFGLLPVQYFERNRRRAMSDGESRLMFAVLQDAIRAYLTNMSGRTHPQRERFREVEAWFGESRPDSGRQGLFGFETLCEALGIKPDVLRRRLATIRIGELPTRRHRTIAPRAVALSNRGAGKRIRRPIAARM
jgi:hypothetical protein